LDNQFGTVFNNVWLLTSCYRAYAPCLKKADVGLFIAEHYVSCVNGQTMT